MPNLKICGITRAEDLVACHEVGVDYIGFNFYHGSRRFIAFDEAVRIWTEFRKEFPQSSLKAVAVSVDASREELVSFVRRFPELAALQLHGGESLALIADLRMNLPIEIWKALPVSGKDQCDAIATMRAAADVVLLDSAMIPQGAKVPGGSGHAFNWTEFAEVISQPGIGVAGGIHPGNIKDLLRFHPQLIDIASGAEAAPGVKSREKVESLVAACRN